MVTKKTTVRYFMILSALILWNAGFWGMGYVSAQPSKGEVLMGMVTDPITQYNISQYRGAILAIEEINAKGGVSGMKFRAVTEDTREGDPGTPLETCIKAVEKLATRDHCDFIFGTWRSEFAIAALETASKYKKVNFVGGATSVLGEKVEKEYDKYKYAFKINGWPNVITSALVWKEYFEYLKPRLEKAGPPLTVFLVGDATHFGRNSLPVVTKFLEGAGFKVAGSVELPFAASDVALELSKARNSGASYAVIILAGGPSAYACARQYYDLKVPMPILGNLSPAQSEPEWPKVTDNKGIGWISTDWFSWPPPKLEGAQAFLDNYVKRWNSSPSGTASGAYETVYALKAAIEKAGSLDPDKLIKALEGVRIPGISKPEVYWNKTHETPHPWGSGLMAQWQGPNKKVSIYPERYRSGDLILKAPYEWGK